MGSKDAHKQLAQTSLRLLRELPDKTENSKKIALFTRKPRIHVRILIYRKRAICITQHSTGILIQRVNFSVVFFLIFIQEHLV